MKGVVQSKNGPGFRPRRGWILSLALGFGIQALVAVEFQLGTQEILLPFGQGHFELGDLDGDGDVDILVTLAGATSLYRNDGLGVFVQTGTLFEEVEVQSVTLLDADQDADLDAWVRDVGGDVALWIQGDDGSLARSEPVVPSLGLGAVAFGDLDGDGDLDAVAAQRSGLPVPAPFQSGGHVRWLNDGQGKFGMAASLRMDRAEGGLDGIGGDFGDVDGDGDLDFVAAYVDHSIEIWLNDGDGGLDSMGQRLVMSGAGGEAPDALGAIALGDFDGDGDLDVIKPVAGIGNFLWKNDGEGRFGDVPIELGPVQRAIDVGDLDNDGDVDVLVGGDPCATCDSVWLQRNGAIESTARRVFGGNAFVHRLQMVDLDSDGDQDFVALVDVFEAPAGRAVVGMWLNRLIDRSVEPALLGNITDPTLSFVLRERLGLPQDLAVVPDFTGLNILEISRSDFGQEFSRIRSLAGLEEATELERIVIDNVMDPNEDGGVLDLRFLEPLTRLRHLSLKGNGITQLILPDRWDDLEALLLDDNEVTEVVNLERMSALAMLSLRGNQVTTFSLSSPSLRLQELDLSENPLSQVHLVAGIPELAPRIAAMRNVGATVSITPRLRPLVPLQFGEPRFEIFADSGRYEVRRTQDFMSWSVVGEFRVIEAGWPGVIFVDETGTVGATAFYSFSKVTP